MFYWKNVKKTGKCVIACFAVLLVTGLAGCASSKVAKPEISDETTSDGQVAVEAPQVESEVDAGQDLSDRLKVINDISTKEEAESTLVSIQGNALLTYTSVKQPMPLALVLYFPETGLDTINTELSTESDVIGSIKASEIIEGGPSKVTIALNKDISYEINRDGKGLTITFDKLPDSITAEEMEPVAEEAETEEVATLEEESVEEMVPESEITEDELVEEVAERVYVATTMESVDAETLEEGVRVSVLSDGTIKDYKTFTLNNPARIVFDLFNIKSPFKGQQVVPVDAEWVKRVRYFTYPDHTRVVIDTDEIYLSEFSATSVADGLVISVGADLKETQAEEAFITEETEVVALQEETEVATATDEDLEMVDLSEEQKETEVDMTEEAEVVADVSEEQVESEEVADVYEEQVEPEVVAADTELEEELDSVEEELEDISSQEPEKMPQELEAELEAEVEAELEAEVEAELEAEPELEIAQEIEADTDYEEVDAAHEGPALVNQTDFSSDENGESTIVIGTTIPVDYNMSRPRDQELHLHLSDARIPRQFSWPTITTRFDSAVDRIVPVHKPEMENRSIFVIELREDVGYGVTQEGKKISIHFQASSIGGRPYKEVALPDWKKVLEDTATEAAEMQEPEEAGEEEMVTAEVEVQEGIELEEPEAETLEATEPEATEIETGETEIEMEVPEEPELEEEIVEIEEVEEVDVSGLDMQEDQPLEGVSTGKFTGEKISLDFYKTDIKNVLRILRDVSGKNFAIDKDVSGSVTLSLIKPVPWDQALDLVLKMNQLAYLMEGDVVRITTMETRIKEEQLRRDAMQVDKELNIEEQAAEPLVTKYISINYADAAGDVEPHLAGILTPDRGNITVDARNNQIIMTDVMSKIMQALDIVRTIDRVTPQVIIEARIVEVNDNFSKEVGTQWGLESTTGGNYPKDGNFTSWTVAMNHPVTATGALGIDFARIVGSPFSLNAMLLATEAKGESKIVSAPRIVTLDNITATIKQGVEVPYNKLDDSGNTTTEFKDVDLSLDVTPHVTPDNRISMNIKIEKNDILPGTAIGTVPILSTTEAETELLVNDSDTIVIGGIIKSNKRRSVSRFPVLGSIPIIGWLFKSKTDVYESTELLIFITPTIVQLEKRDDSLVKY